MSFAKDNAAEEGFNRWTINGVAYHMSAEMIPASFHLKQGKRYRIRMRNASDDIHPIHLHRHSIYAPITAIVRFSGRKASLEFIDPLNAERITLNKQTFALAADFDAPTTLLVARERPERLGLSRFMNPHASAATTTLTSLQHYTPARS